MKEATPVPQDELFRRGVLVLAFLIALVLSGLPEGEALGQDTGPTETVADAAAVLDEQELENLLAPVALYPDALLAQVLVAATYPLDVMKADRWVAANAELAEDARADAAEAEGWDPSVAVLAAGFPTVVEGMAKDIDRTQMLGDAMLTQSDDVLDAVQRLRAQADAMGNLPSNQAQTVTVEGDTITIMPATPDVIYVPTYDSQAVYTTQATAAPVVVDATSEGFSTGALITTGLLSFGAGMLVNELFDDDDDWHGYWGPAYRPVGWGGGYVRPYPWRGGGIGNDVNVNFDRNVNVVNVDRNGNWTPDRKRREQAQADIANRRSGNATRPDRAPRDDAARADLKQKLGTAGNGSRDLEKLKAGREGAAGQVAKRDGAAKLPERKGGAGGSALSGRKDSLTGAAKARDRGAASAAKAGLGDRVKAGGGAKGKAGGGTGPQAIARPKAGGKPPQKLAGKPSAFRKDGGGGGARAAKDRGGKSLGKLKR